jgi:putative nucleotidyltransferase with HDIG domain
MQTELLARPQAPWALRLVPPFPAIAHRILALVGKEDVHARELGNLVKMDPSFSAELLRFASSALFGISGEVTSIAHAIVIVGSDRIKTMATMVAMNRMVRSSVRITALRKVWQHSLVTAFIAEEAARITRSDPDSAYTTGLLHNLGTLGMMSAYPDEYSDMLEVSNECGFDLLQTERELFEIDHCAAGAYRAENWGFPDKLVAAIATHHDEPVAGENQPGQSHQAELAPGRRPRLRRLFAQKALDLGRTHRVPARQRNFLAQRIARSRESQAQQCSGQHAGLKTVRELP